MESLNDYIYRLTNSLWDIHLKLNKTTDEVLDPDLLRGLPAAALYIRHSLWVHKEHHEQSNAQSVQQILMTHRLRRAAEMLEAALQENETVPASPEDLKHLSKIKELSQRIRSNSST